MANGYSIGMTGGVMPNPMGVVGNTRSVTSTMGMTGGVMPAPLAPFLGNLPQSNSPVIVVSESTPNLMEIQNFPVVSRNGIFHIHQDPTTGQRYSMTDEFHMRIPDIVGGNVQNITDVINSKNIDDFYRFYSTGKFLPIDLQISDFISKVQEDRRERRIFENDVYSRNTYSILFPRYKNVIQRAYEQLSTTILNDQDINIGLTGGVMQRQVSLTENINYGNGTKVSTIINAPIFPTNTYVRSLPMTNTSVDVVSTPSRIENGPINTYYSKR